MKYRLSFLLAITFLACNPVKLAFKEKHIEKTKEEFFRKMEEFTVTNELDIKKRFFSKYKSNLALSAKY